MKILLLSGPDARNEPLKEFLLKKGHEVSITRELISLDVLRNEKIDLLISNGYAPIIKEPILSHFKGRILNVHPTYLPFGRGINPNFWSFFEGSPKGVSIHFIDAGIDTGDILFQEKVVPSPTDTLRTFFFTLLEAARTLFYANWDRFVAGTYSPIAQDSLGQKIIYRSRLDSERFMDLLPEKWDTPVTTIEELGADFHLSEDFWKQILR